MGDCYRNRVRKGFKETQFSVVEWYMFSNLHIKRSHLFNQKPLHSTWKRKSTNFGECAHIHWISLLCSLLFHYNIGKNGYSIKSICFVVSCNTSIKSLLIVTLIGTSCTLIFVMPLDLLTVWIGQRSNTNDGFCLFY